MDNSLVERDRNDSGLAILVVIAVTAALAALVSVVTLAAGASAAAAGYRVQAQQADAVRTGALLQLEAALRSGAVERPGVGSAVVIRNGATGDGRRVPVGVFSAPVASWPAVADQYVAGTPSRGVVLRITRVTGPDGAGRGITGPADARQLIDVEVDAWFRSARVQAVARFAAGGGVVRRLS